MATAEGPVVDPDSEAAQQALSMIKRELESAPQSKVSISSLSVKVKWGQKEIKDLGGSFRKFLSLFPDVFETTAQHVTLKGYTASDATAPGISPKLGSSKAAAMASLPPSPGSQAAPKTSSKAMPVAPRKLGWDDPAPPAPAWGADTSPAWGENSKGGWKGGNGNFHASGKWQGGKAKGRDDDSSQSWGAADGTGAPEADDEPKVIGTGAKASPYAAGMGLAKGVGVPPVSKASFPSSAPAPLPQGAPEADDEPKVIGTGAKAGPYAAGMGLAKGVGVPPVSKASFPSSAPPPLPQGKAKWAPAAKMAAVQSGENGAQGCTSVPKGQMKGASPVVAGGAVQLPVPPKGTAPVMVAPKRQPPPLQQGVMSRPKWAPPSSTEQASEEGGEQAAADEGRDDEPPWKLQKTDGKGEGKLPTKTSDWQPSAPDWQAKAPDWQAPTQDWQANTRDWQGKSSDWQPKQTEDWQGKSSDWQSKQTEDWQGKNSDWQSKQSDWQSDWKSKQSDWQSKQSDWQPKQPDWQSEGQPNGTERKADWQDAASPPAWGKAAEPPQKEEWGAAAGDGRGLPVPARCTSKAAFPAPATTAPAETPPAPKTTWLEDSLADTDLSAMITGSKLQGIELELVALSKRLAGSEEMRTTCNKLTNYMRTICVRMHRHGKLPPIVEQVGSYAQGTEIDGSEMDLAVRLPYGTTAEERKEFGKELQAELEKAQPPLPQLKVTPVLQHFPHSEGLCTVELSSEQPAAMAHIILTEQSTGNAAERPKSIDHIVKTLCDSSEVSRELVRLVKLWACNVGLCLQTEGCMGGVSWTLMALYFLQKEELLQQYSYVEYPVRKSRPQVATLFRAFLKFVAGLGADGSARGISVLYGQEFHAPGGAVLFVEDPSVMLAERLRKNVAEGLSEAQFSRMVEEAKKAADRLTSKPQRWFHWAEIFDPREVPKDKIARLAPLRDVAGLVAQSAPGAKSASAIPPPAPAMPTDEPGLMPHAKASFGGKGFSAGCPTPGGAGCPMPGAAGCPMPGAGGCPMPGAGGCPMPGAGGCPTPIGAVPPKIGLPAFGGKGACPLPMRPGGKGGLPMQNGKMFGKR